MFAMWTYNTVYEINMLHDNLFPCIFECDVTILVALDGLFAWMCQSLAPPRVTSICEHGSLTSNVERGRVTDARDDPYM
jgi:hypothetical protein